MGPDEAAVVRGPFRGGGSWRRRGALLLAGCGVTLLGCSGGDRPPPDRKPQPTAAPSTATPSPVAEAGRPPGLHGTWELDTKAGSARDLPTAEREALAGARLELRADGSLARVLAGDRQAGTWGTRGEELVLRFPPVLNEPGAAGSEDLLRYAVEEGGRALRLREGDQEFVWRRR